MARTASYDRDQALDAAMTLFWLKGYHATSLKDLEGALKMKPGSIYAAFQSKEALFRATLERYCARMAKDLDALLDAAASPLEALRGHLVSLANLAPGDRPSSACMLVKSLLEVSQDEDLRAAVKDHLDTIQARLADAVRRAQAAGEIPPDADAERIARRLQVYIFGLKVQAQRETDPARMAELCRDLADELGRIEGPPASRPPPRERQPGRAGGA
ncbi:TetR/AcrR family transcriptional regulator [Acuticoccus sp. I52.16.1]|uniref:TetR/AcrR family transcriptional regulator n=1 Tax=Acuticoccus sp. I52.16.1 TaxID=2928472 RepID=UPI001FD5415F|nr:TetR/AcrR family transcriptional regulator [Acuticoccus sp. I52.16.1]UOM35057.1 TetR/AcrR family transcriptional regulator [Acuticoccus sp. I52.16.1]